MSVFGSAVSDDGLVIEQPNLGGAIPWALARRANSHRWEGADVQSRPQRVNGAREASIGSGPTGNP
jgi:hypothetical protein